MNFAFASEQLSNPVGTFVTPPDVQPDQGICGKSGLDHGVRGQIDSAEHLLFNCPAQSDWLGLLLFGRHDSIHRSLTLFFEVEIVIHHPMMQREHSKLSKDTHSPREITALWCCC